MVLLSLSSSNPRSRDSGRVAPHPLSLLPPLCKGEFRKIILSILTEIGKFKN